MKPHQTFFDAQIAKRSVQQGRVSPREHHPRRARCQETAVRSGSAPVPVSFVAHQSWLRLSSIRDARRRKSQRNARPTDTGNTVSWPHVRTTRGTSGRPSRSACQVSKIAAPRVAVIDVFLPKPITAMLDQAGQFQNIHSIPEKRDEGRERVAVPERAE